MAITANVDQEASERSAQLILNGLLILGAKKECISSLVPFMCLYLFPLCGGNGTNFRPSRDQCIEISTVVCNDEWQKVQNIFPNIKKILPNCESLAMTTMTNESICKGNIIILSICARVHRCAYCTYSVYRCAHFIYSFIFVLFFGFMYQILHHFKDESL